MLDGLMVAMIPLAGLMVMLMLCWLLDFICNLITGEAELPRPRRKKRGVVGQKIRRAKYEYIEILPDYSDSEKDFRVVRVRR
jgi:hypothetical protein